MAETPQQARPQARGTVKYAIWNNKGGVGKTFLSFAVASEFARSHPDRPVVLVDMCPQANLSEIALGGNGRGAKQLSTLLSTQGRLTIGGYFDERVTSPHTITGNETKYFLHLHGINKNLPSNMYIVAGDPSLEIQAQAMNQISAQLLPANSWANVHGWLRDLLQAFSRQHDGAYFFIDCNPSFSAYTALALLASDRVIVPCTADGSSARAINNIGQLLYGVGTAATYAKAQLSALAATNGLPLPSIHVVPLNRSTQYDKKASKAFEAMYNEIQTRVNQLKVQVPRYFSMAAGKSPYLDVPDAHSVAIVAAHEGCPLWNITTGHHDIHGITMQVNPEPLDRYKQAIADLVALL